MPLNVQESVVQQPHSAGATVIRVEMNDKWFLVQAGVYLPGVANEQRTGFVHGAGTGRQWLEAAAVVTDRP
jgi:hypothetical protein